MLLLHEIHEWGHQIAGKLCCGEWPSRDFLYWHLSASCNTGYSFILIALAGPFFTFIFLWMGWWFLLKSKQRILNALGIVFIFASLPFSRILAAAFKGGDEIMAFRAAFSPKEPFTGAAVIAGTVLVLVLTLPPLILAYKKLSVKPILFIALLVLPFFIDKLVLEKFLNPVLKKGFSSAQGLGGAPLQVIYWDVFLVLFVVLMSKKLFRSVFV